mmetsp:Transcript_35944/g.67053  ORF Transcript_35944/g.67053 Transcript_35944/m.67053 type:complete len:566 (+) Transcript_35944:85-1782(+)|eukprot:CAMPEP_0114421434 /NCGR_PEP_ID=MMETSP0103-20121206/5075_1 /TAXON_ID=37642 ORGANISM="Paraphysomonas imperforata, Strain PA2" /NCGR_SAMPLE_ID=MMETSP0103 /ASSEMBLY_ACC=CAM_ASM_000201 /LENGTH=565 /DNA_ID=CAMNT_0001589953 /DNA_START=67 /DNA_END=1764 /DNA_ORIENTATION=-
MSNFGFDLPPPDLSNSSPSPESWLASKRLADSQNGTTYSADTTTNTWRLHDKLYNLTEFLTLHPGGADWLLMTRGTDITELFESHHPNIEKARSLLKKYELKQSSPLPPRNSETFSFKADGFYATLRDRAWKQVLQHSGTGPSSSMLLLHTSLLFLFLSLLFSAVIMAGQVDNTSANKNPMFTWVGASSLAGAVLALLMMCSHNFFHQRDNWRMYVFDLSPFSTYDWRITHAYSHHTFPNTSFDYEVSTTANILNFYPYEFPSLKVVTSDQSGGRIIIKRVVQIILLQVVFLLAMNLALIRKVSLLLSGGSKFRPEDLMPLALYFGLVLCYCVSLSTSGTCGDHVDGSMWGLHIGNVIDVASANATKVLSLPLYVLVCCYAITSWTFMTISLATGHHHPDCWHDGDAFNTANCNEAQAGATKDKKAVPPVANNRKASAPPSVDWGLFQLAAVGDRPGIDSSMALAAVSFGRHTLHHLFPTVDHSKLNLLLPVFKQTCRDFGVRFFPPSDAKSVEKTSTPSEVERSFTAYDGWIGMWMQLWRDSPSERNYISWKPEFTDLKNSKRH